MRIGCEFRFARLALALGSALACAAARADDLAGWMRVGVASNALTAVSMPFSPFGSGALGDFLSAPALTLLLPNENLTSDGTRALQVTE